MRRAVWVTVKSTDTELVIQDVGDHSKVPTITNAAEEVVQEVSSILRDRRLFYYDSEGDLSELLVRDGRFAGFGPGGENNG